MHLWYIWRRKGRKRLQILGFWENCVFHIGNESGFLAIGIGADVVRMVTRMQHEIGRAHV